MKYAKQTENLDVKQYSIYNKTLIIIQFADVVFI